MERIETIKEIQNYLDRVKLALLLNQDTRNIMENLIDNGIYSLGVSRAFEKLENAEDEELERLFRFLRREYYNSFCRSDYREMINFIWNVVELHKDRSDEDMPDLRDLLEAGQEVILGDRSGIVLLDDLVNKNSKELIILIDFNVVLRLDDFDIFLNHSTSNYQIEKILDIRATSLTQFKSRGYVPKLIWERI